MSKEESLLNHILEIVPADASNRAETVLKAIDQYCWQPGNWMMNLGDTKAPLIRSKIAEFKPKRILELGTYCGYSAVFWASQGLDVHTVDPNMETTRIAKAIVEHASVSHQVTFYHGTIQQVKNDLNRNVPSKFDCIFLDHEKELYKQDLEFIMSADLMSTRAMVIADNVGDHFLPNSKIYKDWIRNDSRFEKSENIKSKLEYVEESDEVEVSYYKA